MKTIFRFASLLSAAVMLFASCEGPVDGPVTPPNDEPDVPETEGTLTLEVDKLIIQSKELKSIRVFDGKGHRRIIILNMLKEQLRFFADSGTKI